MTMADQSSISKAELKIGMRVAINPRFDKTRTKLVTGTIEKILTNTDTHPHGILVALQDGEIGRVKKIPPNTLSDKPADEKNGGTSDQIPDIKDLVALGENHYIEYKSSLLWSIRKTKEQIELSTSNDLKRYGIGTSKIIIAKTLASFLNSDGGDLLIGLKENKRGGENSIIGIESEYFKLPDPCADGYRRALIDQVIKPFFPSGVFNRISDYMQIDFPVVEKKVICRINVKKSDVQVFLKILRSDHFFIRVDASTREIRGEQVVDYCKKRFPNQFS